MTLGRIFFTFGILCAGSSVPASFASFRDGLYPSNDIQVVTAAIGEKAILNCSNGRSIHIVEASFGDPEVREGAIFAGARDVPTSKKTVQQHCEDRQNCELLSHFSTFGVKSAFGSDSVSLAIRFICEKGNKRIPEIYDVTAKKITQGGWDITMNPGSHEISLAALSMQELSREYVKLQDFSADCADILKTDDKVRTAEEAEKICTAEAACTFIIMEDEGISLCKAASYKNPRKDRGSAVYVKASKFVGNAHKEFRIRPNVQAICERNQLISEASPVYNVADAASECKRAGCDYFILSTVNGLKGASKKFENHVWLCRGEATFVPHDGFIVGERATSGARKYDDLVLNPSMKEHNGPLE